MIIPGIKLGPNDWQEKINCNPQCAEIWYRADQQELYLELFHALHQRNIPFGLHFWAITPDGHEPNIAYPGKNHHHTIKLMEQCIDDAATYHATYVNIHAGNRSLIIIDLTNDLWLPDADQPLISPQLAKDVRNQTLKHLAKYAADRHVQLLVESVPLCSPDSRVDSPLPSRNFPLDQFPTDLPSLAAACKQAGCGFTNDLGHVFGMSANLPRKELYQLFLTHTKKLAPYTQLIHVNTVTPPYNGTDEHRGILPIDFATPGIFPTKTELIDNIKLIESNSHNDVWLVGEPRTDHVKNYDELVKLIQEIHPPKK